VIQNDQLCQGLELNPYPYPRKIQEFDLNKLDRETFCRTWLVDLTKIQP
jgi:hypothetical protein